MMSAVIILAVVGVLAGMQLDYRRRPVRLVFSVSLGVLVFVALGVAFA